MEELKCPVCSTVINENNNFCPSCGEPLSALAKELVSEQKSNHQLEVLVKLLDYIKDEKSVKFIQGLIDKLSE